MALECSYARVKIIDEQDFFTCQMRDNAKYRMRTSFDGFDLDLNAGFATKS